MSAPWPVQPRGGFTGFPNDVLARAIGMLTPEQLRLFMGLAYSAEYERDGSVSPDGRWRIPWACTLASYPGMARAYGMSEDAVYRALKRFGQVALATATEASPATPGATSAATAPRIVSFGSWFGKRSGEEQAATPPASPEATPPAVAPATIQQENTSTPKEKPSPPPAAPAPSRARTEAKPAHEPDPRHRPLQEALEGAFAEVRGTAYGFQGRDARALQELLRLSAGDQAETVRRFKQGLAEPTAFRRCDTIHELAQKWNAYTMPGPRAAPSPTMQPEWARVVDRARSGGASPEAVSAFARAEVQREGDTLRVRGRSAQDAKLLGDLAGVLAMWAADSLPGVHLQVGGFTRERRAQAEAALEQHGLAGTVGWAVGR